MGSITSKDERRTSLKSRGELSAETVLDPLLILTISTSWQVSPSEIEIVLRQHKYIADAAVVGIRREDGHTEAPLAFIVRKLEPEAQTLQTQDVYSFAREQLASFKALDGGVVFVNAIPRSSLGKIQRFKLIDMVGEESSIINGGSPPKIAEFAKE